MTTTTKADAQAAAPPPATDRAARRIVLFDLDGTVVTYEGTPPGPGRTALAAAMLEVYGIERACDGLPFAGATDQGLVRTILRRAACEDDEPAIARVIAVYRERLQGVLQTRRYRPVGDVAGSVAALRAQGSLVGIATGNVREGARLKLASAGLASSFDLALGGYGCDAEDRADIVRIAAARCVAAHGGGSHRLVVVGDTEKDVRAARAVGARVVGVAGGKGGGRAELEAAGADAIVETCGEALVKAVGSV